MCLRLPLPSPVCLPPSTPHSRKLLLWWPVNSVLLESVVTSLSSTWPFNSTAPSRQFFLSCNTGFLSDHVIPHFYFCTFLLIPHPFLASPLAAYMLQGLPWTPSLLCLHSFPINSSTFMALNSTFMPMTSLCVISIPPPMQPKLQTFVCNVRVLLASQT